MGLVPSIFHLLL